jgi:acetate kinase
VPLADVSRILVVNPGSATVKLDLLGEGAEPLSSAELTASAGEFDQEQVRGVLDDLGPADAIGYRVVHGGPRFQGPVRIDAEVVAALEEMTALAPLHEAGALRSIRLVGSLRPRAPGVACFDTAFHSTLPAVAATYALPRSWRERFGIRRYGFHGLSHAYIARRTAELVGPAGRRIVSCHLGSGASLAAIHDGASVDTTMGFTPLEGLVMGTRSGSVDPGLLVWLERQGITVDELDRGLEHESGLLGLAGSNDMRTVLSNAGAGDADAQLALEVFLYRLRREIAAMTAAMGGIDVLTFTGGVGEHSWQVREGAARGLGFLGVAIDETANRSAKPDAEVTGSGSRVRVLVIAAREDLEIAREVRATLAD